MLLAVAMGVVFVGGYNADARLATLLVGLGVTCEVMGKSWHAIFQAYERLGLVSAALILQRALTAVVGIVVLVAGGGLVAAAAVYLGGALAGLLASELDVPALDARAPPAADPRPAAGCCCAAACRSASPACCSSCCVKVDILHARRS